MSQHDMAIANDTHSAVRTDINNALAAIATNQSDTTLPGTPFAFQFWADTTTSIFKMRNSGNTAHLDMFSFASDRIHYRATQTGGGSVSYGLDTNANLGVGLTATDITLQVGSASFTFNATLGTFNRPLNIHGTPFAGGVTALAIRNTDPTAAAEVNFSWDLADDAAGIHSGFMNFVKEQLWTATGSTQDGAFTWNPLLNGLANVEAMRLTSGGTLAIGTAAPNAESILELSSTTQGLRLPNMTTAQRTAMTGAAGLEVFDTTTNTPFYHDGTAWVAY